jgi:GTP 3',8-cyclase
VMPVSEIRETLRPLGLDEAEKKIGNGPAHIYRLRGAQGTIGLISPVSERFCQSCNRLRLTADGYLRPCLLSDVEIPLLPALRAGEELMPYFEKALSLKPPEHELAKLHLPQGRCMGQIGG